MNGAASDWQSRARDNFESLLVEISSAWDSGRASIENELQDRFAEALNQGLRRLRLTTAFEETAVLAAELAASFSSRCAVFSFADDSAHAVASHGLGPLPLAFSPNDGAAFRASIESRDPVIALALPAEISETLAERIGGESIERVYLFPLAVRGEVKAILFSAGKSQPAVLELIAGIAAMQMETFTGVAPAKSRDFISIQGVSAEVHPKASSWAGLSAEEQALHLRAQRFARMRAAEIRLEYPEAIRSGAASRHLYAALREPVDRAREEFRRDFVAHSSTMVDYLYLEFVRSLAQDDERALGPDFPGPLV